MTTLPSSAVAARRVGERVAALQAAVPPVDVMSLLRSEADVEIADWPFDSVDAIVMGLGRDHRPLVFVRESANEHRLRFTLAHELGHVLIPWHYGRGACQTSGTGDLEREVYDQEAEADIFASTLLLPPAWLDRLISRHGDDMTAIIEGLTAANVSTAAALTALRSALLPGWIFDAYRGDQAYISRGTTVPKFEPRAILTHAREHAHQTGTARLNGYSVHWHRMATPSALATVPDDPRTTTELLKSAISARIADEAKRHSALQGANGTAGALKNRATGRDAHEVFATLEYKIANSRLAELLEEPDFRVWMARKAQDISRG